jgi:hypothetical protein
MEVCRPPSAASVVPLHGMAWHDTSPVLAGDNLISANAVHICNHPGEEGCKGMDAHAAASALFKQPE